MLAERKAFHRLPPARCFGGAIRWSMPNGHSAVPNMSFTIWRATLTASPFPNHRIVNFADGRIRLRWKDYAHKSKTTSDDPVITAEEFLPAVPAPHSAARVLCVSASAASPRQPPPEPAAGLQATSRSRSATAKCHGAGS